MVRLAAAVAINSTATAADQQVAETDETQEKRIQEAYTDACNLLTAGDRAEAKMLFEQLLEEPALQAARSSPTNIPVFSVILYCVLKDLATIWSSEDDHSQKALQLYVEAAQRDITDAALWRHTGTLAGELGHLGIARHALESGLRCIPQHFAMQSHLLEVVLQLADWQSVVAVSNLMLTQNPRHVRATAVSSAVHSQLQPDLRAHQKRPASSSVVDTAQLKSQIKRRRVAADTASEHVQPAEHHIHLTALTWDCLLKAINSSISNASRQGRPGAYKVVFSMPELQSDTQTATASSSVAVSAAEGQAAVPLSPDATRCSDAVQPEDAEELKSPSPEVLKAKPSMAPVVPQRASKRLGLSRAVTEAGSDRETPEPSKNMVELLAPFLAPYPADAAAKGADLASELEPKSSSISGSLSAAEEQQSVHQFVKQQHGNGGLYQVAAAALERVLLGNLPAKQVSDLNQELIKLESVVRGWQRVPAVAIALAEMCFQLVQQQPIKSSRHKQRHSASHSKHDQLLHSCIANVGIFEAALLMQRSANPGEAASADSLQDSEIQQGTAAQPTALSQPSLHSLVVRYYWLGGCVSEHLKQHEDAAQQYEACKAALSTLSEATMLAQAGPVGSSHLTISQVDSSLARLRMVTMVEDGRKSINQGQQSELIARLSPVLLAGVINKIALEVPQHLAGLELLQEAASDVDDWQTHLQCLLAKASLQLNPMPDKPSSSNSSQAQPVPSPAILTVVTNLNDTLTEHLLVWEQKLKAANASAMAEYAQMLTRVQWQVVGIIHSLYCSLAGSGAAASPNSRTLDLKEQKRQNGLLDAFHLLLKLRQLDMKLACDAATQLQLLATAAAMHSDTGTLSIAHGAFLKTCLYSFAPFFADACKAAAANADTTATGAATALIGAAAQCVHLLYGLELPIADEGFTEGYQGRADKQTPYAQKEAFCLWMYLAHFCPALTTKSKPFKQRLQELLGAIADQLPPPPDSVLAQFDLDALLDSHASTAEPGIPPPASAFAAADPMQQAGGQGEGLEPMQVDPAAAHPFKLDEAALQQAVQDDPDSGVHSQLYHLLAQCQPDMFDDMAEDVILRQEGHEQIQETLLITRYDLCYNPRRYESWERVVNTYITAGSALANAAANHMSVADWQENTDLRSRFRQYCSRAFAAIHHAKPAAAGLSSFKERSDTLAFLEEWKGTLHLELSQDVPPMYDQMRLRPDRDDLQYQQACLAGLQAFQNAQITLDAEWEFPIDAAKLMRKLGRGSDEVLHQLAKACLLARQTVGGSVESFYQLHAMRLKLLQKAQPDLSLIQRHCFLPETRDQLLHLSTAQQTAASSQDQGSVLSAGPASLTEQDNAKAELLYLDAMAAMDFCLEQSKQHSRNETFHRARFRRAQALHWKGQYAQALEELQPFFSSRAKHGFAINIFLIPDGKSKATKAYAAPDGASEEGAATKSDAEEHWGQKVPQLACNGVEESSRKFKSHVRRAIILYILLLVELKDLDTLQGLVSTLRTKDFAHYADIGRWANGMYIICLASALQQVQLPVSQQGQAATATDTFEPTAEMQSTVNWASAPGEAAPSAPVDSNTQVSQNGLLEKAFQLYQDTCLSSDPQHSWTGLVEPSLHDALTFHRPDTRLLSNAAIDPEIFHSYAVAYVHSLGSAGHGDKLSNIQQATRRQMRRTNASAEACQSLFTAATAALQAVNEKELSNLESQVDSAVQIALQPPSSIANHAAAAESGQPLDHSVSQAASAREGDSHQPRGHAVQDDGAQASEEQAASGGPSGAADFEQPNKELLTALLAFLKKLHILSRPARGHGLAAADDTASAELLSRAYTSYLQVWYPKQSLTPISSTDAASGVDKLLQQSKSGPDPPKPPLPDSLSQQQLKMPVSTVPNVSWMSLHGAAAI